MDCDIDIDFDMEKQVRIEEILNSIGYNTEKIMREVGYLSNIFIYVCTTNFVLGSTSLSKHA